MNTSFTFDVVIPTCNNLQELKACLRGLARQTLQGFRVLVCVDGSQDGTIEYLTDSRFPFVLQTLMHPGGIRKGRAATRNLCLPFLRSKYVCFLDSDIRPAEGLLEAHLNLMEKEDCMSLGEILYTVSGDASVSFYLQSRGRGKYKHGDSIPGYGLTTGNVAFQARHFIQARGMDERFGLSYGGEDTDLGYRLSKTNRLKTIVNKMAMGHVLYEKPLSNWMHQLQEFGQTNLHYLRKKHPELVELFRMDLLESRSPIGWVIRIFIHPTFCANLEKTIPVVPRIVRNQILHVLVFLNIGLGYLNVKSE